MEKQNKSENYVDCEVEKGEIKKRAVFSVEHNNVFRTKIDSFRIYWIKIHLRFP